MNNNGKVLITTSVFGDACNEPIKILEDAGYEIIFNKYKRKLRDHELVLLLEGVIGVIAGLENYSYKIIYCFSRWPILRPRSCNVSVVISHILSMCPLF